VSRTVYRPVVCLDCANGVGAVAVSELVKYLHAVDVKFDVYNDGSHGKLNHMVDIYIHINVLTVLWIRFCCTRSISLCIDSFVFISVYFCNFSYCIVVVLL